MYIYKPYTKNERGRPQNGRYFPIDCELEELLKEIRQKQKARNLEPEFIFTYENGDWMKYHVYGKFLRNLCEKLGYTVTNNHAFRKSLNSNVFIPLGLSVADRAYLLGQSIETNLKYYSFPQKDIVERARNVLDQKDRLLKGAPNDTAKTVPDTATELENPGFSDHDPYENDFRERFCGKKGTDLVIPFRPKRTGNAY